MKKILNVLAMFGAVFLLLAIVGGSYLAYKVYSMQNHTTASTGVVTVPPEVKLKTNTVPGEQQPVSVAETVPASGFTVQISALPASQQSVVRTLGFTDSITFTPTMVLCAEAKLGSTRINEIKLGAAPTILESASLLACL
jgi:hypothetical protein